MVLTSRGPKGRGLRTRVSFNHGFLELGVLQPGVLTSRGLTSRGSYNLDSYNQGF